MSMRRKAKPERLRRSVDRHYSPVADLPVMLKHAISSFAKASGNTAANLDPVAFIHL